MPILMCSCRRFAAMLTVVFSITSGIMPTPQPAHGGDGDVEHGRAIFAAAAGCGCHTTANGPIGAGGQEIVTDFGTFYATNITPDEETGIGRWTDEEIDAALRRGIVRGSGAEAPVMPYYRYAGMADSDVADLITYLRSLPAVTRENRPHDVSIPLARWAFWGWRLMFAGGVLAPPEPPVEQLPRGRYLVDHVAICGDCHTPRSPVGASDESMYLAGTARGPNGDPVPNITPHPTTGVGDWEADDLTTLLELGVKPDFDNVQGLMAEMIDGHGGGPGYAHMPAEDRKAIAAYLKTIAPVANDIGAE